MTYVKTGGVAPKSGQYRVVGGYGEITLTRGERVPPYGGRAATFQFVDATRHLSRW